MIRRPWSRDLITSLIGLWIVAGVHLDGWAHVHIPELETFFTPWHASFYSGLLAFGCWMALVARAARQPGDSLRATLKRMPTGYRGGVWGAGIFALGGLVDMIWHTYLGIEVSIAALLSPPHLLLLSGVLLMGTTAWRSQRALSVIATVPEVVSLTSVVAISGFFLNFLSPFQWAAPTTHSDDRVELVIIWVSGQIVTTVLLLGPLLWQIGDGRDRAGTLTAFTAVVSLGMALALSHGWSLSLLLTGVAGAVIGSIIGEVLIASLPWRRWRYGLPVVHGVAALLIWSGHLAGLAIAAGVDWPVTLWAGSLLFNAGTGAAVAAILWRASVGSAVVAAGMVNSPAGASAVAAQSVGTQHTS